MLKKDIASIKGEIAKVKDISSIINELKPNKAKVELIKYFAPLANKVFSMKGILDKDNVQDQKFNLSFSKENPGNNYYLFYHIEEGPELDITHGGNLSSIIKYDLRLIDLFVSKIMDADIKESTEWIINIPIRIENKKLIASVKNLDIFIRNSVMQQKILAEIMLERENPPTNP